MSEYGICPSCRSELKRKHGIHRDFIWCSAFPVCKYARSVSVRALKSIDIETYDSDDFAGDFTASTAAIKNRQEIAMKATTFSKTVTKQWEMFDLAAQHLRRIALWGPPGVGKTYGACALREPGQTLSITLSEDIVSQELMGHYIPKGNEFIWHDGPVTTAVREGYNVVVNELGRASAAVKDMFLGVLDNPEVCKLTMPTGEVVKPKDTFRVIATSNSGPEELDPALADRFEAVLNVSGPHPDLVRILDKALPGLGESVMNSYATPEPISCRSALTLVTLLRKSVSFEQAATIAFGTKARVVAGLGAATGASK